MSSSPPISDASVFSAAPNGRAIVSPRIVFEAQPFDLADVTLLDSPFKQAMERDRDYLLQLEPDRFLHNFRKNAGLEPKAPIYGGWESTDVAGINLGHYMTASAMYYRVTDDERFKERLAYIVDEIALCQQENGNGYVAGIPNGKEMFAKVAAGQADALHGAWVPWYPIHKLMAGLRDAYIYAGNDKAGEVLLKLVDWAIETTRALDDEQWQVMLRQEHGGMSEVLADIYALTGRAEYLQLSQKFYHRALMEPLVQREDNLTGQHGNTQSPKLIGLARLYELTGDERGRTASEFFWDRVVHTRTFAIGGHTEHEHFAPPGELSKHLGISTSETCKTYNLLRLTRHLFEWTADAQYADFYERALYNHILASQDTRQGMFTYFMSLRPGHFKTFSTPFDSFWCCVGTGMENHVKYGDSIYFYNADVLYINLFIASELNWKDKGLIVRQETSFPESENVCLTISGARPTEAAIKVRYPAWAQGMTFAINGQSQPIAEKPGGYVTLQRRWQDGDRIDISLPMRLHLEATPDNPRQAAILYGPIVLAGQLGAEGMEDPVPYSTDPWTFHAIADPPVPVLLTRDKPLDEWIQPVPGQPLTFQTVDAGDPHDVLLRPFYNTHFERYNVYWDFFTLEDWRAQQGAYHSEQQRLRQRYANEFTVDELCIGEQKSEADHHFHRDNASGFSFELRVIPTIAHELACTYKQDDDHHSFDVLVNDQVIATETLLPDEDGGEIEKVYAIPHELTKPFDKPVITVRLQAKPGSNMGSLADCRTLHLMGR